MCVFDPPSLLGTPLKGIIVTSTDATQRRVMVPQAYLLCCNVRHPVVFLCNERSTHR